MAKLFNRPGARERMSGASHPAEETPLRKAARKALPPTPSRETVMATPDSQLSLPFATRKETFAEYAELVATTKSALQPASSLAELYPDVRPVHSTLSHTYDFPILWQKDGKVNGVKRTEEIVEEQQRIMQETRVNAFLATLSGPNPVEKNRQMVRDQVEAFKTHYTSEEAPKVKTRYIERKANKTASIINGIADGDPATIQRTLTSAGFNMFEGVGISSFVVDALKDLHKHVNIPILSDLSSLLKLQDNKPDTEQETQEARSRIQKVFQDGRQAMLDEQIAALSKKAEHRADLHSHTDHSALTGFFKRTAQTTEQSVVFQSIYEPLGAVMDRVDLAGIMEHLGVPEHAREKASEAVRAFADFVVIRLAMSMAKAGVALQDIALGGSTHKANRIAMDVLLDVMQPMNIDFGMHEDKIGKHVLGQYATTPAHADDFFNMYAQVAALDTFADLERQDLETMAEKFDEAKNNTPIPPVFRRK